LKSIILNTSVAPFKMYFEILNFILENILDFKIFENIFLRKLPAIWVIMEVTSLKRNLIAKSDSENL